MKCIKILHNKEVHPHGPALCDGKDNDCDGKVVEHCAALQLTAAPNPSQRHFSLRSESSGTSPTQFRIVDAFGRVLKVQGITPNSTIVLGQQYGPGVYYDVAVQDTRRVTRKLVKQSH